MEMNEKVLRTIIEEVIQSMGADSFGGAAQTQSESSGLSLQCIKQADQGTSRDEVVIGLAPAFKMCIRDRKHWE